MKWQLNLQLQNPDNIDMSNENIVYIQLIPICCRMKN